MALIKCKECGHEISDKAQICPNCGTPVGLAQPSNQKLNNADSCNNHETKKYGDRQNSPYSNAYDQAQNNYNPSYLNSKNEKPNSRVLGIILSLAAALVIIFALIVYLNNVRSDEVEKERLKAEKREKEIKKLNREYEQAKRQRDSLMAATEVQRMEKSLRIEEQKRIEAEKARKRAQTEAETAAIRNIRGSYYLNGTVKNNRGRGRYWFTLSLEIYNGNVRGSFETSANAGPVSGSIDQFGNMKVYELDYDYCQNGYYWTGKFNGKSYKGKYLNYNNTQNMSFWTN